jgi:hypothetical protein
MQHLRILLLGTALAITLGSTSSNQQAQPAGYYPQAQPQAQQPPPPEPSPPPPVAAVAEGTCQAFCTHVVDCKLETFDSCMRQCHDANFENQQGGAAFLTDLTRTSCERIAELAKDPPPAQPTAQPPVDDQKRTQWLCNAQGLWQKCETKGFQCYPQTTFMLGFGATEALARSNAESVCNSSMSRLMSANFTYRTSVTAPCKTAKCTPPNAR